MYEVVFKCNQLQHKENQIYSNGVDCDACCWVGFRLYWSPEMGAIIVHGFKTIKAWEYTYSKSTCYVVYEFGLKLISHFYSLLYMFLYIFVWSGWILNHHQFRFNSVQFKTVIRSNSKQFIVKKKIQQMHDVHFTQLIFKTMYKLYIFSFSSGFWLQRPNNG